MKNIPSLLIFIILAQVFSGKTFAVEASGRPFYPEASLTISTNFEVDRLKAEKFHIYREQSALKSELLRQTKELELLHDIAAGRKIGLKERILVPEALPGAVLLFASNVAGIVIQRRLLRAGVPLTGPMTTAEIVNLFVTFGGTTWFLYEIIDKQRVIQNLQKLSPEQLQRVHQQKADEYNNNLALYNQMGQASRELELKIQDLLSAAH